MIHLPTFFALVVGGMEAIQPAVAGVISLDNAFHRRQGSPSIPPQCATLCNPVTGVIASGCVPPSSCCSASFETQFFNCLTCAETAVNVTDFTQAQTTIDTFYDDCASAGIQLPVLIFPGQNPSQPLSPVASAPSTQVTVSTISSTPQSIGQSTVGPSTAGTSTSLATITAVTQSTVTTNTPNPTSTLSFGIKSAETSCFNVFAVAVIVGFYFAV